MVYSFTAKYVDIWNCFQTANKVKYYLNVKTTEWAGWNTNEHGHEEVNLEEKK